MAEGALLSLPRVASTAVLSPICSEARDALRIGKGEDLLQLIAL